jgi:flagellar secretion chaperone FliS
MAAGRPLRAWPPRGLPCKLVINKGYLIMRPNQTYQRVNISTADPVRIIVLLYEGAIKNLNQGIRLMDDDGDTSSAKLSRTLEIINYLRNALDHEKGGEIALNLGRLYDYMRDTLAQANIQRDKDKIKIVISLLQTLLEGWRGITSNQTTDSDALPLETPASTPTIKTGVSMVG